MVLVALKNLLFGRPGSSNSRDSLLKPPPSEILSRPLSYGSTDPLPVPDLESQELSSPQRGFQVTARILSDATIGLSDGLTVPFALTAGLSAIGSSKVVIFGGLAELIAGAISMGLGGYLGAKSEIASYNETLLRTISLCQHPSYPPSAIASIFEPYSLPPSLLSSLSTHLSSSPDLPKFLMHFLHCAEAPSPSRALTSAITIALAYFLGGLVPLLPYFWIGDVQRALMVSVCVMAVALFAFGYVKTAVVVGWEGGRAVRRAIWGGVQMVIVGGLAAGAAMGLVKGFDVGVDGMGAVVKG